MFIYLLICVYVTAYIQLKYPRYAKHVCIYIYIEREREN